MTAVGSTVAIRKQNGVYSIYTGLNHWIGSLYFVSYRELLLATTLSAYNTVADAFYADLRDGVITLEVAMMGIIGVITSINGLVPLPGTIGSRNMTGWLTGRGARKRQRWTEEICA